LCGIEGLGIQAFAKECVCQVKLCVVGIRICLERGLELCDGVVVEMITGKQNARSARFGRRALDLIELAIVLRASATVPARR